MTSGLLIDLSGTVHVGSRPISGAVEAVRLLRREEIPFRFVTNTSRKTRTALHRDLATMGIDVREEEIFTAPLAVRRHLERNALRPYLLVHPNLLPEFDGLPRENPNAVVVGFAQHAFAYESMNRAFRLLKEGAPLLATGRTRYFQGEDGLDLDAGPFVAALEYAAGTEALVLGKPSPEFFLGAVAELGWQPGETVMIGDDALSDVGGALAAGLGGILVRTGKYRQGDEEKLSGTAFRVAADLAAAVAETVGGQKNILTDTLPFR